jgi:hypothetical protein
MDSLPSVEKRYSAKSFFAECLKKALGKESLCRVSKSRVPEKTLGKTLDAQQRSFFRQCTTIEVCNLDIDLMGYFRPFFIEAKVGQILLENNIDPMVVVIIND